LLLFAATVAIFLPVARDGFLGYDDSLYITDNPEVQAGLTRKGIAWAFTTFDAANWHPLTWLSHMADVQMFGLHAAGHHLASIFIHALNGVFLFWLLFRATGKTWRSFFVAAIFAVHPLSVESVAWIAERKNLLSTFFGFATIAAYGWYVRKPNWKPYLVVASAFAAILMAKPMLVTLPFALLLLDYWPLRRWGKREEGSTQSPRQLILEKLPLLVLAAASSVVTVAAQRYEGAINPAAFSFALRFENALLAYVAYLGKIFWPANLSISYPHIRATVPIAGLLAAAALLLLVTWFAIRRRAREPYLLVGWLWFLGTLVPVIGLIQVGSQAMADRYIYVPMIGIIVAAVWLVCDLASANRRTQAAMAGAGIVILAVLAALTIRQESYWRDDVTLFSHALEIDPENNGAHDALGMAIAERGGDLEDARAHFETALRINPKDQLAFAGLGYYFNYKGELPQAAAEFNLALANTRSRRVRSDMYNNLAAIALKLGDAATAKQDYQLSLQAMPHRYRPWANLGFIDYDQGQFAEAIDDFKKSVAAQPTAAAYIGLGRALHAARQNQQALNAYRQALMLAPDSDLARREMQAIQIQPYDQHD
jgi:Tfp pilus assembly protein PilF